MIIMIIMIIIIMIVMIMIIIIIQTIIIIIVTMLTDRFATTFTANWQNCYRKFGSFATFADLLPGFLDLLPGLADLLRSDLFTGRFATKGNESRWCDEALRSFDAPFVKAVKKAHMQLGRDFSIAKIFFC